MSAPFVELLGRTNFSFLQGASRPEEMVTKAKALGLSAIAICDRDGVYGLVRAHAHAKEIEQHLIVGTELTLEEAMPISPNSALQRVALLVETHAGYANLCRLLTQAHAHHEKGTAGVSAHDIAESAEGLTAVVPIALSRETSLEDSRWLMLRESFGERMSVAVWKHLEPRDAKRIEVAKQIEARYGLPIVASARPLFHESSRKPLADVLYCIRHKTTLAQAGRALLANAEARLRSDTEMRALFSDHPEWPEWIERTSEIAMRCQFSLSELKYGFPSDVMCQCGETPDAALRRLVERGCLIRYGHAIARSVREQIEKELALIARLNVAPYFLSVHQIVEIARAKRILCQGRGSAANSAVCYVLGITAVDPARSNLLFERFLSEERNEPPDIDVDFEHERREEVIQAIYEMYGRERAAMVSEVICYRGKSALREVGKAFGFAADQVDRLSGLVFFDAQVSRDRLIQSGLDPNDDRLLKAVHIAGQIDGFPRHLSIHVGGFVISSKPLCHVAPIEPARMDGRTVIPWDKDDLDTLGFFKIDVLGLGMLTAIRKTLALIHSSGPGEFDPIEALANIPAEDPKTYEAIQRADTIGVFQIESRAQMAMLPRLRPKEFYDLVVQVAIVRPGPIQGGMVHPYLRRRMGEEAAVSPHPCLEPILSRTLGVPLFQEQVMQIAMTGAGYTAGEADQLRRDMAAWKRSGKLARHREKLLRGFGLRGISPAFGEKLYRQIQGFGEYGFPESHAASFALLVYASSWLKTHHPAAFACALLNSQPMGFYSTSSIAQDAQRHGVEVLPVCVMESSWDATLASPVPSGSGDWGVRLGFREVKGIGEGVAKAIACARQNAPFESVHDFIHRTELKKNDVESLAEAGALEVLKVSRRQALWDARAPRERGLFDGKQIEKVADVDLPPMRPVEQLVLDYARVGVSLRDHPMHHVRASLAYHHVLRAKDLRTVPHGTYVHVAGVVIGRQRPATASGVTFITLEDETGMVNLIVHLRVFDANHAIARFSKLLAVEGRLERQGDVIHVLVQRMRRLMLPSVQEFPSVSRDFH